MGFLRQLFGPSKDEVWQQLAAEIGATFVDGGFWNGSKVQGRHGEWTITLDTFTVTKSADDNQIGSTLHSTNTTWYTRMRAPYVNKDGLRFTIYRTGIFSGLGKWLGMQDIETGDAEFDKAFVIKGDHVEKVREVFANSRIRELLHQQPWIELMVIDDEGWFATTFPQGVDELYFQVQGVIKNVEQLKSLYQLFAEVLDQLCRVGSAYENDPGVAL